MSAVITRTADPAGVSASSNVATYSSVSIGTAASDRVIVLCVGTEVASGTIISATIDYGSGDTAMIAYTTGTIGNNSTAIFAFPVPTGTTATFKVTYGANCTNVQNHICVYAVTGGGANPIAVLTVTDTDADPITTAAINVPANGGLIAVYSAAIDTNARTWTGATEDLDEDAGDFRFSTATTTTGGSTTITVSGSNLEDAALSYIVIRPAPTNFGDVIGEGYGSANTLIATSKSLATPLYISAGDLVFINWTENQSLLANGCTDNLGNTYTPLTGADVGNSGNIGYFSLATTGGACTPTVSVSSENADDYLLQCVVYKGSFASSPLDINPAVVSDSATPYEATATGTLSQADALLVGYYGTSATMVFSAPTPTGARLDHTVATNGNATIGCVTSLVVSSTSSVTMGVAGDAARTTACGVAVFKKFIAGVAVGAATGTGASSVVGKSDAASPASATGTGASSVVGNANFDGIASSAGVGSSATIGNANFDGIGGATGIGDASAIPQLGNDAVGAASGFGSALGIAPEVGSEGAAAGIGTSSATGHTLPTFWNPADANAHLVLSNNNLTVTRDASATSAASVRSSNRYSSRKRYAEITIGQVSSSPGTITLGIANVSFSLSNYVGLNNAFSLGYFGNGDIQRNGSIDFISSYGNGDIICLALDLDNLKVWFRKNNGLWNNNASHDPATNIGGYDISGITGDIYVALTQGSASQSSTINFGSSAFSFSVPSGFNDFDTSAIGSSSGIGAASAVGQDARNSVASAGGSGGLGIPAVHFDGSTAWLEIASLASTDSPLFSFSFWMRSNTGSGMFVARAGDQGVNEDCINLTINGKFSAYFHNVSYSREIFVNPLAAVKDKWHHVIGSVNTDGNVTKLYIDRVAQAGASFGGSASFDLLTNGKVFSVGASPGGAAKYNGDFADVWLAPGQSLLDGGGDIPSATLDKFITSDLRPVNLGSDGSTPTGTAPRIFFTGDAASFPTNRGSGGSFTLSGSLTTVGDTVAVGETAAGGSVAASSGAGAASATGEAFFSATVSATGVGAATAVGSADVSGVGTAAGAGSATGFSPGGSAAASAGTGTANATSNANFAGAASSAGTGAASAVGKSISDGAASAAAVGAASGIGSANFAGVASSTGTGAASATGKSFANSIASAAGTSTAIAVTPGGSTGVAVGTSTANAIGASTTASASSAAGVGAATGIGVSSAASVFAATGAGAAAAIGKSFAASVGSAAGVGTSSIVGKALGNSTATASGAGTATATGIGAGIGMAVTTGTGAAASFSTIIYIAAALSDGIGVALGIGSQIGSASRRSKTTSIVSVKSVRPRQTQSEKRPKAVGVA